MSTVGTHFYNANGVRAKTVEGSTTTGCICLGHNPVADKAVTQCGDYVYASSSRLVYNWTSVAYMVATYKPFGTPVSPSDTEKVEYALGLIDSAAGASPTSGN